MMPDLKPQVLGLCKQHAGSEILVGSCQPRSFCPPRTRTVRLVRFVRDTGGGGAAAKWPASQVLY